MIQSDIIDSLIMNIKKITNTALKFALNRLIEIIGISVIILAYFYLFP